MPIREFQCQGCGNIEEEIFLIGEEELFDDSCSICTKKQWKAIISSHVVSAQVSRDNNKWPYLGHVRDENGERPVFTSRKQQEEWMRRNGFAYVDPDNVGVQAKAGSRPPSLQRAIQEIPQLRKYIELKDSGRIPSHLVLSEQDLKEKFDVPA